MHPSRHLVLALLLGAALLFPASSRAGDYSVRLTTTAGSHWVNFGGAPFITTPQRVYSGTGNFVVGDYKSWRMSVPGDGARIVGGRVGVTMATPTAGMRGRILVGTGNSPVVLLDSDGGGTLEATIAPGTHDWIQFDLRAASVAKTTETGSNWINLSYAELVLRDSVPPVVTAVSLPTPTAWYNAWTCIPYSVRVSDQGGGLARATVRSAATGAVVTDWVAPQAASPRPGPIEQQIDDCIQASERGHGDTAFIVTAWDVSGATRELSFSVRADHVMPTIGGGPDEGASFNVARPGISFEVADDGTGVAAISATVDGAPVGVTVIGTQARLDHEALAPGPHTVALAISDGSGNGASIERHFTIVDSTPPVLVLSAPAARGEATTQLKVAATDDMTGVDHTGWSVLVDDRTVAFSGTTTGVTATLGPMDPGTHRITVRARDAAGNIAKLTHDYYVVPPPPPPAPAPEPEKQIVAVPVPLPASALTPPPPPPGRSGLVVVDAPRAPVGYGMRTSVSIHVARLGSPVPSQLVEIRRDRTVVASAVTDDQGIARVSFVVGMPGEYSAHAVGLAMEPVPTGLKVAPRLLMTTSVTRPRVGQRVAISGRIVPPIRGRRVAVEARVGGVWFPVRRAASTNSAGAFRSHVVANTPGTVWVRVRLLAVGAWGPAISNQRALAVRRK